MCGRIAQYSPPDQLGLKIVNGVEGREHRFGNYPPRYNGSPSQELLVIRRHPETGENTLDLLQWGLIPSWAKEKPKPPPINARAETVAKLPMFRSAYTKRRCIFPIDNFYEWKVLPNSKSKQPFAIAMQDRSPFGLAGLWENWRNPANDEWVRTFAVVTATANDLVGDIHNRMPVILPPEAYADWLGGDSDPADLMRPYAAEAMTAWPVSTKVNSPRNDDPSLLEPALEAEVAMPPRGNSA